MGVDRVGALLVTRFWDSPMVQLLRLKSCSCAERGCGVETLDPVSVALHHDPSLEIQPLIGQRIYGRFIRFVESDTKISGRVQMI